MQALGFVHYLVAEHHEFRLWMLLRAFAREDSVAGGFEWTYGVSLSQLEERWWAAQLVAGGVDEVDDLDPAQIR